jgi:hypothetical protein
LIYNFLLQIYSTTGIINCDNLICPSKTHKCIVKKITDDASTVTTRTCYDAGEQVLDQNEDKIANDSGAGSTTSYGEADVNGKVSVRNESHAGNSRSQSSSSSSNSMSPQDMDDMKMRQEAIRDSIRERIQMNMERMQSMSHNQY